MNILFVVPYAPNLIRTRPYNFIRGLARRGHAITLATLWENPQELKALHELEQSGIEVVTAHLTKVRSGWNALGALPTQIPLQAVYCWHPELFRLIDLEVSKRHFDVVHVEHLRGARYGLALKSRIPSSNSRPVFIWDSVDCISYLFKQASQTSRNLFGRFITRIELPRTRRYEAYLTNQFVKVLVTSEKDRQALTELQQNRETISNNGMHIQVIRNGVDLDYFVPRETPRDAQTIVLTGKMSYHANVTAALYLVNEVMPRVWQKRPDARVQIVGHRPPNELVSFGRRFAGRVEVTGTVPDVRPYLAKATLAAVPILYGAGIQNKVLEAMAMATPVVATSKSVSAISVQNGDQILLGDTPEEFASQILRLLDDVSLSKRLTHYGRQYIESSHDWNCITEKLEKTYAEAIVAGKIN